MPAIFPILWAISKAFDGIIDIPFAKLTDTELVVIDENTDLNKLQSELDMLDLLAKLK